jgi:hypothetical protein
LVVTDAVVATFTITDCISPVPIVTDEADKVQVGGGVTAGVIVQLKLTFPENKLLEARVSSKFAVCPAAIAWEIGPEPALSVKACATVSARLVLCVKPPEVPVTVTGPEVAVAAPAAVSVSVLVLVAEFGLKVAVTPLGKPEAERDTLPLNPFWGVIVIVPAP